jgi:phospholipid/cholesterol/gamma-HCH transport system substrate-binding protein
MISSYVKKQLIVLTSLSVAAVLIIVLVYAHIPTVLGFGQMKLTAYFTDGAGVYKDSNVTTRGVVIGKVKTISLTPQGVKVDMSVDNTEEIGANAHAAIHSVSAVGEIYVDLVSDQTGGPFLTDGSVIPIERTEVPEQIAPVLDKVTGFIHSFPNDGIQTFLDEGSKAFDNLGPDLRTLIDAAQNLTVSADQHFQQTQTLLNTVGPLLDTQVVNGYGDNIKRYFSDLAHFTGAFRSEDDHFRSAIDTTRGAVDRATDFLQDNENTAPILARNMRAVGHLLGVYRDGIEQVLVEYPIALAREQWVVRGPTRGLHAGLNTVVWQGCSEGFRGNDLRNYNDLTDKEAPANEYCKAPHDAQKYVRGARNIPCSEGYVGMRAATVDECFGRRPDQTPGTSGFPAYNPPTFRGPQTPQRTDFDPHDNQRNYQHSTSTAMPGGEPLDTLGAKSTAAPVKEESWQSLLSAPLNA